MSRNSTQKHRSIEHITRSILVLRGQRVILDRELATIYGVTTQRLHQQVERNAARFPEDLTFQLTPEEAQLSTSQISTSKGGRGQSAKYQPRAFTEHGALQASNVLNSPRAVAMGVYVLRAFAHMRDLLESNREPARRFTQLEKRLDKKLLEHDHAIDTIRTLLSAIRRPIYHKIPGPARRPVGFNPDNGEMP